MAWFPIAVMLLTERQTNTQKERQTNEQSNATENIISFAKEISIYSLCMPHVVPDVMLNNM